MRGPRLGCMRCSAFFWSEEEKGTRSSGEMEGLFLSKMDLSIMVGDEGVSFSASDAARQRAFWCFIENKRGYYFLTQSPKRLTSQLGWMKGSEDEALTRGPPLNRGEMETALHFSSFGWIQKTARSKLRFLTVAAKGGNFAQREKSRGVKLQFVFWRG